MASATGSRQADGTSAAALADFLRLVRSGMESGLDPLSAAERAAAGLPQRLRRAVEAAVSRLRGDYHEDEWGFDEQFAESVYPLFELLYERWWRVEVSGIINVPAHEIGRAHV
jgi:hypothetical protein